MQSSQPYVTPEPDLVPPVPDRPAIVSAKVNPMVTRPMACPVTLYWCVECGSPLPPGRPNRKCLPCRSGSWKSKLPELDYHSPDRPPAGRLYDKHGNEIDLPVVRCHLETGEVESLVRRPDGQGWQLEPGEDGRPVVKRERATYDAPLKFVPGRLPL